MSDMFLLSEEQMSRISPFFPLAVSVHGAPSFIFEVPW
jgi:hypothetical protein